MFNIFLLIFIISMLICGTYLLIRAFQLKLANLLHIGMAFLFVALGFIGNYILNFGSLFEEILVSIGFVFLIIFTNLTFHKNRKNLKHAVLIIVIILSIFQVLLDINYSIEINPISYYLQGFNDMIYTFITFNWLTFSTYQAYTKIRKIGIEPWVKIRYEIIIIISFVMSFQAFIYLFLPWDISIRNPSHVSNVIAYALISLQALVFGLGFSIAWIMPNKLKRFLSKGFNRVENQELMDISETALFDKIK